MFRAIGVDLGSTGTRQVSVGLLGGKPMQEGTIPQSGVVIANVPSDRLTFRSLNVPLAGRDVVGRVVREELSDSLPFPIDEAAWDWIEYDGVASVIVAPNEEIAAIREQVGDRATLDAEPLSYLRACLNFDYEDALVFDFGASRTTICAIKERSIDWVRVSFRGGKSLNRAIAKRLSIDEHEAEQQKQEMGMREPECRKWLQEIVAGCLLKKPIPFEHLLICGGGSSMPGLVEELTTLLDQKPSLFPLPAPLNPNLDVAAFGAALAAKPRRPKITLLPAVKANDKLNLAYLVWVVILLVLATGDLEVRHKALTVEATQNTAVLTTAVKAQAPALSSTPIEGLKAELLKRVQQAKLNNMRSPERLLNTLAALAKPVRMIPDIEIRSVEYKVDNNSQVLLHLEGQASSIQQVEEFRVGLANVLDKPELIENRSGAADTSRFAVEGTLPQE